jgi:hypothetical protein
MTTSSSSSSATTQTKVHDVEYGEVGVVAADNNNNNNNNTKVVNKKLKLMVSVVSMFAVLLVVCVFGGGVGGRVGVSPTDLIMKGGSSIDNDIDINNDINNIGRRHLASASASASNSCTVASRRNLASASSTCPIMTSSGQTACTPDAPIDLVINRKGSYICCKSGQTLGKDDDVYYCKGDAPCTGKFCR